MTWLQLGAAVGFGFLGAACGAFLAGLGAWPFDTIRNAGDAIRSAFSK